MDIFLGFVNPLLAAAAMALAGVTRGQQVGLNSQGGAVLLDELDREQPQRWGWIYWDFGILVMLWYSSQLPTLKGAKGQRLFPLSPSLPG